ncbi:MAG: HAD family hydrolase [Candidatus Eutrophobiaceae bacterium]
MQDTIALIFDFDDTLAPDSTTGFLHHKCNIQDMRGFWGDDVGSLIKEDWDLVPAYLYKMIEMSRNGTVATITKTKLEAWGRELPLYEGVEDLFPILKAAAQNANPSVKLEFYLISSGIGDIIRNTRIAQHFSDIWTSEFHCDESGQITYPKKIISFTDKTRYVFQIQKGLVGQSARGKPFAVNSLIDKDSLRVPFSHMIVVGDGATDVPCFSMIGKNGGTAIAVYDRSNQDKHDGRAWGFIDEKRAHTLHQTNYQEDHDLFGSLELAITSLAKKIGS